MSELKEKVALMREVLPQLDEDVCLIFLEENDFIVSGAVKSALENEKLYAELFAENSSEANQTETIVADPPDQILSSIYPGATKAQINSALAKHLMNLNDAACELDEIFNPVEDASQETNKDSILAETINAFQEYPVDYVISVLEAVDYEISGAFEILMRGYDAASLNDPVMELRGIFEDVPYYVIEAVLRKHNGDKQKTALELSSRDLDVVEAPLRPNPVKHQRYETSGRTYVKMVRKPNPTSSQSRGSLSAETKTVDLHGMNFSEAYCTTLSMLRKAMKSGIKYVHFITGKGLHSSGGRSVIRPMVMRLCKDNGCHAHVIPYNKGVVVCEVSHIC